MPRVVVLLPPSRIASSSEPPIAARIEAATIAIRSRNCLESFAGDAAAPMRWIIAAAIPGKTLNHAGNCVRRLDVVKRVLIVDDHLPFRAVARELLERAGYVVSGEAADAAQALDAIASDAPDAVLLDVQLPDRDGFMVAAEIAGANGPAVVLVSSREADDYGQRVEACGARGFISKSKLSAAAFAALLK